jgi:transposase InsO family protein
VWLTSDRAIDAITGSQSSDRANVLDRSFDASTPNRKWIADFTYVWTAEGWLYVAVVIDLFSRRVVGWSMSAEMTAHFVTDALMMPMRRRGKPDALLHHSDRVHPKICGVIPLRRVSAIKTTKGAARMEKFPARAGARTDENRGSP